MPIIKKGDHVLEYRFTSWDENVFQKRTIEITKLKVDTLPMGKALVQKLLKTQKPEVCYGRFSADNIGFKKIFLDLGFFPAESQAALHIPSLENYELPKNHQKRILQINEASENDRQELLQHTLGMFRFSRFHEDPYVDVKQSDIRMQNWVKQLVNENNQLLIYKMKEALTSFVFYDINNEVVTLKLGGSIEGKGIITPYFFGSVLDHFKKLGFKKIDGVNVSIANTGIFKVYLALNFELRDTFVDYHWHQKLLR